MANFFLIVFATAVAVLSAALIPLNNFTPSEENSQNITELEILKKITIERMKSKILKSLGMEEPPTFSNKSNPLSKEVIQMLIDRSPPTLPAQQQQNLINVMIFPKNSDFQCRWYNESSCRRFDFSIPHNIMPTASEFWVHKLRTVPSENLTISTFCASYQNQSTQKAFEQEEFLGGNEEVKWLFFQLPTLKDLKFWHDVVYSVEITGIVVDEQENNLPFLKITGNTETRIRTKKTEGSTSNDTCITIPLNITFKEIGFGDWVIQPESYVANLCIGKCQRVKSFYEAFMLFSFENDETREEKYGRCWATSCRPNEYENLKMFYTASDGFVVDHIITDVIVKSCSCS